MIGTQAKLVGPPPAWRRALRRILTIILAVVLVGLAMRQTSAALNRRPTPAGFFRGMLQGALMPAALPNLLVGNDIIIYAQNNTGVRYKLGYTVGVNACGTVFFGLFFWRLNRWRRRLNGQTRDSD